MRSIRTRLVVWSVACITLFLAGGGLSIYWIVRARILSEVDRSLSTLAQTKSAEIALELGKYQIRNAELRGFEMETEENSAFLFDAWLDTGNRILHSPALEGEELQGLGGGRDELVLADMLLPSGAQGRAVGLLFEGRPPGADPGREGGRRGDDRGPRAKSGGPLPRGPEGDRLDRPRREDRDPFGERPRSPGQNRPRLEAPMVELVIARDLTELNRTLADLRLLLGALWAISAFACAVIVSLATHVSLRPMGRLRRELAEVDEQDLDHRFSTADVPVELLPVVDQLNSFVDRIGSAFEREQLLTAHAAHELRTPVAGLRTTLEVALSRERAAGDYREAAQQSLDITLQMQTIIEGLLDLARMAEGSELKPESLPVAAFVESAWKSYVDLAEDRGVTLQTSVQNSARVMADPRFFERVLHNLLENAAVYADPGSAVECSAKLDGADVVLVVANHCAWAPADVAEKAFDVLWRGEGARSRTGEHSGLGLALCRKIVTLLGGSIEASYASPVFRIKVRLPAA